MVSDAHQQTQIPHQAAVSVAGDVGFLGKAPADPGGAVGVPGVPQHSAALL